MAFLGCLIPLSRFPLSLHQFERHVSTRDGWEMFSLSCRERRGSREDATNTNQQRSYTIMPILDDMCIMIPNTAEQPRMPSIGGGIGT